jgi:hypothetical protein
MLLKSKEERDVPVQWGPDVLDQLVAPKCSALTRCFAPELPEPPNFFWSFFLNNVSLFIDNSNHHDNTRWPTIVFLRRLANGTRAYRDSRNQMLKCVAAARYSSEMVRAYLDSLSRMKMQL